LGDKMLKLPYAEKFLSDRVFYDIIGYLFKFLLDYDEIISEFWTALCHGIVALGSPSLQGKG
jgi:hypothetical protein